jgi:hypothetical protein
MTSPEGTTLLSVRSFPTALHQRLRVAAVKRQLSMGELLSEIVEKWLVENEPADNTPSE